VRTTLELDRQLLERAKDALGAASFTEAIETALRQAVARADARTGWEALIGSELSWQSVEDFLRFRRRYGSRSGG
jgi:hypothetical protein